MVEASSVVRAVPWGPPWTVEGVIELLEPMVVEPRRERLRAVIAERVESVTVLMDAPRDPHNGAAVLRSCDAFGVQDVHVIPKEDAFPVSSGVAKGTERWLDVTLHRTAEDALRALRARAFTLVATHPRGKLVPGDLARVPRLALVLGNEHDGIGAALTRAADESVRIPMRGFVESLNVSVAGAVLIHAATAGRPGDLPEPERRLLYARGLHRTVARAAEVLAASAPR
ncbi:MAG: RNA methyltransferase [Sorangiineae bacterium]|nr:RNA methyltransferase [Polyangiaceae bacterium]MEB2325120.1 RNA methyltransferase [Sorangiineae bacterium]